MLTPPLRENGSTTFFLIPFLPLDRRLFYGEKLAWPMWINHLDAPFLRPWCVKERICGWEWTAKEDEPALGQVRVVATHF
jgi:hypothetical protein